MRDKKVECQAEICALVKGLKQLGSEWKMIIVYYLLEKPLRFNEILKKGKTDELNSRTLTRTLRDLQSVGIVQRQVVGTQPFSVQYYLTEKGRDLAEILGAYTSWSEKWITPPVPAMATPQLSRIKH